VCGENCKKSVFEIRQTLAMISAANASSVAMFDAGPTLGSSRDSRLLADDWLPELSKWVAAGGGVTSDSEHRRYRYINE
jgi:hypothetical protein